MANNWWRRIRNKLQNPITSTFTSTSTTPTTTSSSTRRKFSRGRGRGKGRSRDGYTMHSADHTHAFGGDDYESHPFSDVGGLLSNLAAPSSAVGSPGRQQQEAGRGEGGGSNILRSSSAQWPLSTTPLPQPPPPAVSARGGEKKPIIDEEYSSLSLAQAQAQAQAHAHAHAGMSPPSNNNICVNGTGGNATRSDEGLIEERGSRLRPMRLALRRNS